MPTDIDLEGIKAASSGFAGRFEFQPEHTEDRGIRHIADFVDFDDRLVYLAADRDDDEPYVIADCIDPHVAEPIALMLNAVPALVARVEDLEAQLQHAISENFAFSIKAADEINDARWQTTKIRALLREAVTIGRDAFASEGLDVDECAGWVRLNAIAAEGGIADE